MIVGDLFAGVGGMSEGFKMAGDFEIAFAVEFDKEIASAYHKNHIGTDVYPMDIREIDVAELHKKHPQIEGHVWNEVDDKTFLKNLGVYIVVTPKLVTPESKNMLRIEDPKGLLFFLLGNLEAFQMLHRRSDNQSP